MIEPRSRKKMVHRMTALAVAFELPRVWVLMAAATGMGQRGVAHGRSATGGELGLLRAVTVRTFHLEMSPFKREIGPRVV